jgi:hypothetical protein
MGIIAPLQNAQPAGAKLPAKILISPMNGLDTGQTSGAPTRAAGRDLAESVAVADDLRRDTFDPQVGTRFGATSASTAPVELELVEVSDIGDGNHGLNFRLLFRGPRETPLGQGMVELEHPAIGAVAMFMVPVGADAAGAQYEVVFNRLPPRP